MIVKQRAPCKFGLPHFCTACDSRKSSFFQNDRLKDRRAWQGILAVGDDCCPRAHQAWVPGLRR